MEDKWAEYEKLAKKNKPDLILRPLPYNSTHIVGKNNCLDNGGILYID